ncbi:MAG TPA: phospholipase D-like domain-containing protein [Candidatus Paceibacterota bacterium]|nr:phospholipase D-like domain-containing protein [Candidatus Paceibacterota bacterium]
MKAKYIVIFCVVALFAAGSFSMYVVRRHLLPPAKGSVGGAGFSLVTEPDDGVTPVLAMIRSAARSVDLVMYELDDAQVESALAVDEARGVAVRVILGAGYDGTLSTGPAAVNSAAYGYLRAHGVPVRWSPGYFSLTHQKSLVADGDRALIMTFNLVSKYYPTGRDFGVADSDPRDVAAIVRTFDDDWDGSADAAVTAAGSAEAGGNNGEAGDDLVWSPGARPALLDLVNSAKRTLYIYNEEMADPAMTKALIDASRRGTAVYVVMTGADEWKWEFKELATAGAHVRTYADADDAPLYIHAKMIVADAGGVATRAFIGSENFSAASLDNNRELGIVTADPAIVSGLVKTFISDWRGATPFGG